MKNLYTRGLMLSPVLMVLFMSDVHAQSFVYTDNNRFATNSVTAFSVGANGALTNIGTFATGGSGSGAVLSGADRARTTRVGNRLYVTNDGDNSVSGFDINPVTGSLTLVPSSPFATGGLGSSGIALDCSPNGSFLFAASAQSNGITVFSIAANGALAAVAGSPFFVGVLPRGIKVTPNGQFLSVALTLNDAIGMFSIAANGALTPAPGSPFASPAHGAVSGVEINCAGTFLYATQGIPPFARPSSPDLVGTQIDVFSIGTNGALTLIQTSDNPGVVDNTNVGVLSQNDQFLFVSNQLNNSVTVLNVAANGTLSPVAGSPFSGSGARPTGIATNAAGTFLFTADFDTSTVTSFNIAASGALTSAGSFVTGQPTFTGLTSLAAFPGKSCGNASTTSTTIGVYFSSNQTFYLRNSNSAGFADLAIRYGPSGATPLVGDWDGNGTWTIGVYDPNSQTFYLRNTNSSGLADVTFRFGPPGAIPLAGDWNGDGVTTIGVYDPSSQKFYLRNSNTPGFADLSIRYGPTGILPVVGDWDGNGTTTIGVYDPGSQTFYLRNSNTPGFADLTIRYGPSGATPVVGDWDGNGTVTIGVYDPANQKFYLRNSNTIGFADLTIRYGPSGATPLAGDWNGQ